MRGACHASAIERTANAQCGYFTATQAAAAGFVRGNHSYYVKGGHWQRVSKGLYRLPGYPDNLASVMTRWSLWSRNQKDEIQAAISYGSALKFHGLSDSHHGQTHLTVPLRFQKNFPSQVAIHKASLTASHYEDHGTFRVTTPLQTLKDMADMLREQGRFVKTVRLALEKGLVKRDELEREGLLPDNLAEVGEEQTDTVLAEDAGKQVPDKVTLSPPVRKDKLADSKEASAFDGALRAMREKIEEKSDHKLCKVEGQLNEIIAVRTEKGLFAQQEIEGVGFVKNRAEAAKPIKAEPTYKNEEDGHRQTALSASVPMKEPVLHTVIKKRLLPTEEAAREGLLKEGAKMEQKKVEAVPSPLFKGKLKSWSMPSCAEVRSALGSQAAFTLVELLVVIAIISILAGLLLPALGKVRATAYKTQCASRMRQVMLGVQFYTQDHRGIFPRVYYTYPPSVNLTWSSFLVGHRTTDYDCPVYLEDNDVVVCPSQYPKSYVFDPGGWGWGEQFITFGLLSTWYVGDFCGELSTDWIEGGNLYYPWRIKRPSRVFLFADTVRTRGSPSRLGYQGYIYQPGAIDYNSGIHLRHGGTTNLAYVDGHVSSGDPGSLLEDNVTIFVDKDMNEISQ